MAKISIIITYRPGESTELSESTLEQQVFKDFTITKIEDTDLRGCGYARNKGFYSAPHSEFVLFCDNDIEWKPEALENMYNCLVENPDKSYCYGAYFTKDRTGKYVFPFTSAPDFNANMLIFDNYISTMSLIRTCDFPGFDESVKRLSDWDLWLTMLENGKTGISCGKIIFITPERNGITKGNLLSFDDARNIVINKHTKLHYITFVKRDEKLKYSSIFIAPHSDDEALFGCYTIMKYKPLVAIFNTIDKRKQESLNAMRILGVDTVFINSLGDLNGDFELVFVPALEHGHPFHDLVHEMAKKKYKNIVYYSTYRKYQNIDDLQPKGNVKVFCDEKMKQTKLNILQCYQSQIIETPCHFLLENKDEYCDRIPEFKIINKEVVL